MNTITTAATTYTPPSTSVVHNAQVSLTDRSPASVVHLSQYDTTMPIIAVALTANGQPYTVPSGAAVNVRLAKPDGTFVYNPALGVSGDAQTAYIGTTVQMTTVWGQLNAIVEVVLNGAVAGTGIFILDITANPVPESAIESTDEFLTIQQLAAQVQQAADLVEQNAQNLQTVVDNLEDIQNAAANAQAAAKSAQDAQTAAQQALGFRTFFSAISPDANGNLDPSRPMTTPSAQASWTIESRGDRIQSVQVNGFTQQAGTGDASPTNVRAIKTACKRMVAVTFDGSADESWSNYGNIPGCFYIDIPVSAVYQYLGSAYCSCFRQTTVSLGSNLQPGEFFYQTPTGAIRFIVKVDSTSTDTSAIKNLLQANPATLWFVPADESQASGLYIPIQAQGHEYRCQCLELTAPLCDGDKVESCVPSGCDKMVVLTGDMISNVANSNVYFANVITDGLALGTGTAASDSFIFAKTASWANLVPGQFTYSETQIALRDGVHLSTGDKSSAVGYYNAHPVTVYYRSTAYTEQNDIPVQLETHSFGVYTMTGNENIQREANSAGRVYFGLTSKNAANQTTSIICSQAKGGPSTTEGNIQISSNTVYVWFSGYGLDKTVEEIKEYIAAQYSAGTGVTIVYELATPSVYAHDPVTLVAVPYTVADVAAANQLANTPSTLPAIDSPDVPMLLDAAEPASAAAPLAATLPVAGTYIVSSQDGTTVLVSLKAMQDGGDAATVVGMTLVQAVLDLVYPVGSIYMSVNNVSPQTFLGGTWEPIEDCFIMAADSNHPAGSTGGSWTHVQTESEIAPHAHAPNVGGNFIAIYTTGASETTAGFATGDLWPDVPKAQASSTSSVGSGTPMDITNKYFAAYMWQRTE